MKRKRARKEMEEKRERNNQHDFVSFLALSTPYKKEKACNEIENR